MTPKNTIPGLFLCTALICFANFESVAEGQTAKDDSNSAKSIDGQSEGTNWVAFRGDGNSHTSVANLPTQWGVDKNIAWKSQIPGYGQSSPVIWGNQIFVSTMQGDMKETPTIVCFDLNNGKQVWKKEFESTQKIKASDYVTRSSPTPTVDADRVYSFFESGELIATDHDGNVKWQRSLVEEYGEYKGNHGVGSSLAANKDLIFVLAAHEGPSYLLAVNKSDGSNAWKTELEPKVSWSSPTVDGNQVLLSISGSVRGFDVSTGEEVWAVDELKGNTVASPTIENKVAYIGASEREQSVAIQLGENESPAKVLWKADEATSSFGSPLVYKNQVYFVNKQGVAFAVDKSTGKTSWKNRLNGSCWASPVANNDNIYFFTKEGVTDVYDVSESEPKLVSSNTLTIKDRIYGVALATGRIVVRTGSELICISESPQENLNQEVAVPETDSLKIADCPIAVTSFGAAVCDGHLYFLGGNVDGAHTYSTQGQNRELRRIKIENGAKWESLGEVPNRQGNALVTHGGKLYRIGGFQAKNQTDEEDEELVSTADFSVYDPGTSKWTDLTPLPEPRSSFDAVVAGDSIFVVGGWALNGDRSDSQWHGTAWEMDLSKEKLEWKSIPAPPERRANSLAQLDGKIYLIGGMGDDASPTKSVMVYDTATKKWADGPDLPGMPMDGFGNSSFNVGGKIIVSTFGGQVIQLSDDGKSWEQITSLETGRFFHRLVSIDDQRFIIMGGTSPSAKQKSVLVLDRTSDNK